MKRLVVYLAVACVTFGIILFLRNPDLFHEIWLWVVGVFGVITGYVYDLWESAKNWLYRKNNNKADSQSQANLDEQQRIQELETVVSKKDQEIEALRSVLREFSSENQAAPKDLKTKPIKT